MKIKKTEIEKSLEKIIVKKFTKIEKNIQRETDYTDEQLKKLLNKLTEIKKEMQGFSKINLSYALEQIKEEIKDIKFNPNRNWTEREKQFLVDNPELNVDELKRIFFFRTQEEIKKILSKIELVVEVKEPRVAVCEHTKKEIIQIFKRDEWICLHNESEEMDKASVEAFKRGRGDFKD